MVRVRARKQRSSRDFNKVAVRQRVNGRQYVAELKDGSPCKMPIHAKPHGRKIKSSKNTGKFLSYANRRTWSQATLTAVCRVFRIYWSAGATTATAAGTACQTANYGTRLGWVKVAHPCVLFNLLRCHGIAHARRMTRNGLPHAWGRWSSIRLHSVWGHAVGGVSIWRRGSAPHGAWAGAERVARRLARSP